MPFLTVPIGSEGPLVEIYVALSTPHIDALRAAGLGYPPPVQVRALIDTGSSISAIAPMVATKLGIPPRGTTQIRSASTGPAQHTCNLYDVCIAIIRPEVRVLGVTVHVIEVDLSQQGIDALIGRDLLAQCLCVYDGKRSELTLAT